jgi:hypothetical protein
MADQVKPQGGLTMPVNPAIELQEIMKAQMDAPVRPPQRTGAPEDETAVLTGRRESGSAGGRTAALPSVHPPARTGGSTAGMTEGREGRRTARRTGGSTAAHADKATGSTDRDDLLARVRAALQQRRTYVGGVKPTIDISPELSDRVRLYCAQHRGVTLRQLVTELLDAFLTAEGIR